MRTFCYPFVNKWYYFIRMKIERLGVNFFLPVHKNAGSNINLDNGYGEFAAHIAGIVMIASRD